MLSAHNLAPLTIGGRRYSLWIEKKELAKCTNSSRNHSDLILIFPSKGMYIQELAAILSSEGSLKVELEYPC